MDPKHGFENINIKNLKDRPQKEPMNIENIYEQNPQPSNLVNWPNKMKQKTKDAYYQRYSDNISINEESKTGCI